ncbi:unnamed protein product [marine sediment metagenome]|uniref:Uncharacterized protein n=1 Tax=marine sediment metagenome TaxID=412755 RepID=X1L4Z3_9ZZZZ
MSEKKQKPKKEKKLEPADYCPVDPILTFGGIRKIALDRAWKRVEKSKKDGIPLLSEDFGRIQKEEWAVVKKQATKAKKAHKACLEKVASAVAESKSLSEMKGELEKRLDNIMKSDKELKELGIEKPVKKQAAKKSS